MGSKKRSSWQKQKAEFNASLGGMDSVFAREEQRTRRTDAKREEHRRTKACESKNRYSSRSEAMATIAECEAHGTYGLQAYKCPYCNGWHLTSHPWK